MSIAEPLEKNDTTIRPDVSEPGDHDKMAHYVPVAQLTDAMVFGTPLRALCGKLWVPTRDGLKFSVCPQCKEIWERLEDA